MVNHRFVYKLLLLMLCLSLFASASDGDESEEPSPSLFNTVGIRVGTDSGEKVSLNSYELYTRTAPFWSWDISDALMAGIGFDSAIGILTGEGEEAAYVHLGFNCELVHENLPISLVFTTGPSLYSEDTFDEYDLGGNVQFTSSVGFSWQISTNLAIEYRYQHTSNAGLESENPGLDMHVAGISYSL